MTDATEMLEAPDKPPEVDEEEADNALTEEQREQQLFEKRLYRRIARKQRIFNWIEATTHKFGVVVWAVAIVVGAMFLVPWAIGLQATVVLTGSMSGTIEPGSVVLAKAPMAHTKLATGEIVVIKSDGGSSYVHRIIALNQDGTYTTRGDANDVADLFKPSDANIVGVLFNVVPEPQSKLLTLFAINPDWTHAFGAAVSSGQWAQAASLLPLAPWGFITLALAGLFFWGVVPRLLQRFADRAERREAFELEKLKQQIADHSETIGDHDEALTELEPVVEELKQDHDAAKAEKEAEFQAQVATQDAFWDAVAGFDPESIYDPDPFVEAVAEPSQSAPFPTFGEEKLTGELPPLADHTPPLSVPVETRNPFEVQKARKAAAAAVARDLSATPVQDASTHTAGSSGRRNASSAFDLSESWNSARSTSAFYLEED